MSQTDDGRNAVV